MCKKVLDCIDDGLLQPPIFPPVLEHLVAPRHVPVGRSVDSGRVDLIGSPAGDSLSQGREVFMDGVDDELGGQGPGDDKDSFVRGEWGGQGEDVGAGYVADVDLIGSRELDVSVARRERGGEVVKELRIGGSFSQNGRMATGQIQCCRAFRP